MSNEICPEKYVLAPRAILCPAKELNENLRVSLAADDSSWVLSLPQTRVHSKVLDENAAILLRQFESPCDLVSAVISYSEATSINPHVALKDAWPFLNSCVKAGFLLRESSTNSLSAEEHCEIGMKIDRWVLTRRIQKLDDTELWEAHDNASGSKAAVKVFRLDGNGSRQCTLERELRALTQLPKGIAPALLGTGSISEFGYLVISWIEGERADVAVPRIRRGDGIQFELATLATLLSVVRSYTILHNAGVVHGDVHPGNMLINEEGHVTLVDFGAASCPSIAERTRRVGVPFFFEPELALAISERSPPPSPSTIGEQFSIAAVLYFLLCGRHYVQFSAQKEVVLRQICCDLPRKVISISGIQLANVEEVLHKALSKAPEDRFESTNEFEQNFKIAIERDAETIRTHFCRRKPNGVVDEFLGQWMSRLEGMPLNESLQAPTSSVTFGRAGTALGLLRIATTTGNAHLLACADQWLNGHPSVSRSEEGFYNDAIKISFSTVGALAFYHSLAGIAFSDSCIAEARGDVGTFIRASQEFNAYSQRCIANELRPDLTCGLASIPLACALLIEKASSLGDFPELTGLLKCTGLSVVQSMQQDGMLESAIRDCKATSFLGIAHGWAGILYSIMRFCVASGSELPSGVKERLFDLSTFSECRGSGRRWPVRVIRKAGDGNVMTGWCNGSAGHLFLWSLAGDVFQDSYFHEMATGCGYYISDAYAEGNSTGYDLCCGDAGRAYALLNLFRSTKDQRWYDASIDATKQGILKAKVGDTSNAYDFSLFKGQIGLACVAADVLGPRGRMPAFEE